MFVGTQCRFRLNGGSRGRRGRRCWRGRGRRLCCLDDACSGGDLGFGFTSDPEDAGLEFIVFTERDANLSEQGVGLLAGVGGDEGGEFGGQCVLEDSEPLVVVVGELDVEDIRNDGPVSI